jgi:rhomboid family GlyGly-CTERM serine protease
MSDANRTQDLNSDKRGVTTVAQGAWLVGLLVATVVLLSLGKDTARMLLRYDRIAILDAGEYWRLATGHLVHGSFRHLALNLAGLVGLVALFPRHYSLRSWLWIGLASVAAIDVGFVWNEPQLTWYVGLSGLLHGVLAAGAIAWWRFESKALAMGLTLVVIAKLTWEQVHGALPLSGDMSVVVVAHLYGAIGGSVAAGAICLARQRWPGHARPL